MSKKCQIEGCDNEARDAFSTNVPICMGCVNKALADYQKEHRYDWVSIVGFALVFLLVLPMGCGVMVGSFVWSMRAIAGWP